ncbi:MAG: LysR family transcriptional regulator [Lachnospiraceae bacterium]|nr:LysR family transcriptional regulator [Lachnospiraceae bacterium]
MTTDVLQYFLYIAQGGITFENASEEFHISQSSISKMIRSLEDELGCQLFDRTRRSVSLTEAGKCFYNNLMEIRPAYQKMMSQMRSFSSLNTSNICFQSSAFSLDITRLINRFNEKNPNSFMTLKASSYDSDALLSLLYSDEADFGIMHKSIFEHNDLCNTPLKDDQLIAIFSVKSKTPKKSLDGSTVPILWAELRNEKLLIEKSHTIAYLMPELNRFFGTSYAAEEIENWPSVLRRVSHNEGITLAYYSNIDIIDTTQFHFCPISDIPDTPLVLTIPKSRSEAVFQNYNCFADFLLSEGGV